MQQKLPVNNFKWVEETYPKKLHELRNDLSFVPERMKIAKKNKKKLKHLQQIYLIKKNMLYI